MVLCNGGAWTHGAETDDPAEQSYPAQLQLRLDMMTGQGKYRVVNLAQPTRTSARLVKGLEARLRKHRPQIMAVLVGGDNFPKTEPRVEGAGRVAPRTRSVLSRLKVVAPARLLGEPRDLSLPRQVPLSLPPVRARIHACINNTTNSSSEP